MTISASAGLSVGPKPSGARTSAIRAECTDAIWQPYVRINFSPRFYWSFQPGVVDPREVDCIERFQHGGWSSCTQNAGRRQAVTHARPAAPANLANYLAKWILSNDPGGAGKATGLGADARPARAHSTPRRPTGCSGAWSSFARCKTGDADRCMKVDNHFDSAS